MDHTDLPVHAISPSEMQQWQDWSNEATDAQLLDAFLARLHPGRTLASSDHLEPIQRLLVEKLRSHLQPDLVESEVA